MIVLKTLQNNKPYKSTQTFHAPRQPKKNNLLIDHCIKGFLYGLQSSVPINSIGPKTRRCFVKVVPPPLTPVLVQSRPIQIV